MRELRRGMVAVLFLSFLHLSNVEGKYRLIDLDSKRLDTSSEALAINNDGTVVGRTYIGERRKAALFNSISKDVINLGSPDGLDSVARDINDSGIIIGEEDYSGRRTHAVCFDPLKPGTNTNLGGSDEIESRAFGINNDNVIVGQARVSPSEMSAAKFVLGNPCTYTTLPNGPYDQAEAVCASGESVGYTCLESGYNHAALFCGKKKDLGTLTGGFSSKALDINDIQTIVGSGSTSTGETHAVKFGYNDSGPNNKDLGTLGGQYSEANAVNNNGTIVGIATDENGILHAILFDSIKNIDLNSMIENRKDFLGYNLACAYDINDRGDIVGYMTLPDSDIRHAFLLTHAPEPSSLLSLLGMGMPFFYFTRRKI